MKSNFILLAALLLVAAPWWVMSQDDEAAPTEVVTLKYYTENNSVQYLVLENHLKTGKKSKPLTNKNFVLYLDSVSAVNQIARVNTDKDGMARTFIPPALQQPWQLGSKHTFLAVAAGKQDEIAAQLEIARSIVTIDTLSADGSRNIKVQVMKNENNEWAPAGEVELKVGIQRLGSMLSAGEEETYTSDSTGMVTVVFNKDSLPGDLRGNIVLLAKIENNDELGNVLVKKTVPWGVVTTPDRQFFEQRSLWATQFRTPLWLLFLAYTIIGAVWGTIIYLVYLIIRIKKLGQLSS